MTMTHLGSAPLSNPQVDQAVSTSTNSSYHLWLAHGEKSLNKISSTEQLISGINYQVKSQQPKHWRLSEKGQTNTGIRQTSSSSGGWGHRSYERRTKSRDDWFSRSPKVHQGKADIHLLSPLIPFVSSLSCFLLSLQSLWFPSCSFSVGWGVPQPFVACYFLFLLEYSNSVFTLFLQSQLCLDLLFPHLGAYIPSYPRSVTTLFLTVLL